MITNNIFRLIAALGLVTATYAGATSTPLSPGCNDSNGKRMMDEYNGWKACCPKVMGPFNSIGPSNNGKEDFPTCSYKPSNEGPSVPYTTVASDYICQPPLELAPCGGCSVPSCAKAPEEAPPPDK